MVKAVSGLDRGAASVGNGILRVAPERPCNRDKMSIALILSQGGLAQRGSLSDLML